MKKIYALMIGLAAIVTLAVSCSKKDFADKYLDPSKTTTATCDKLMTGAFVSSVLEYKSYAFNGYWRMYTWENFFGKVSQTIGTNTDSGNMYFLQDGYAADRWENFYEILRQYRIMQKLYDEENDAENRVFLALTEVYLYDHLSQLVDVFGPVPFTEAGMLAVTGELASSYPAYDSDVELYKMMLTNLDNLYTEIGQLNNNVSSLTKSKLAKQDIFCGGDLEKWQVYANALLLRLGVHVAAQGSLEKEGKAAVATATKRKLPMTWAESIRFTPDYDGFNFWDGFSSGFIDINAIASQKVIDAMNVTATPDPRLRVIYFPDANGDYVGKSYAETAAEQDAHATAEKTYEDRYYARLNRATFAYNGLLVSPIISAAECYFLLAEAYQKGYVTGNPQDAFVKGVVSSIDQYYTQNVTSDQSKRTGTYDAEYFMKFDEEDIPSAAASKIYAEAVWGSYTDKMEAIMTQKWVHFGIMQPAQAWTDIRRTGYPKLSYPTDSGNGATVKNIVQRVKYPNVEVANNTANYEANKPNVGGDTVDYVLFWAKKLQ